MLRATGLSLWHGGQVVLAGIDVGLDASDRVGVVGPNGIGKSTLLRVLAGLEVARRGLGHPPPADAHRRLPAPGTGPAPGGDPARLPRATHRRRPAPTPSSTAGPPRSATTPTPSTPTPPRSTTSWPSAVTTSRPGPRRPVPSVGLLGDEQAKLGQPMATLSGGEAARALLAAILLSRHDVLLLDEPTNDLDFAGLDQLEAFMASFPGAVMVVSHDRAFLDRSVTGVLEIDENSHRGREYAGGWTEYLDARDLRPPAAVRRPRQVHLGARPSRRPPTHADRVVRDRRAQGEDARGEPDKNLQAPARSPGARSRPAR